MRDAFVTLGLSFGLAAMVTGWLSVAYGLLFRPPRWRVAVVLLCPVMSPIWAFREGMPMRGLFTVVGAISYALAAWDAFRRQ